LKSLVSENNNYEKRSDFGCCVSFWKDYYMNSIILTGFMGSGKSTVGKALSEKTGFTFIDMDDEIVKREGRSINDIFKDDGEEYFRNLETSLLKEYAASDEKIILSTGGGVILREENVMLLKKIGKIFFLQADTDELIRRLSGDTTRPLLKSSSKEELQARIE